MNLRKEYDEEEDATIDEDSRYLPGIFKNVFKVLSDQLRQIIVVRAYIGGERGPNARIFEETRKEFVALAIRDRLNSRMYETYVF